MRYLRLAQSRSVVFERLMVRRFVDAEAAQAIGVRELTEMAQLLFRQRCLQFISNFHECHGVIIAACGKRGRYHFRGHLT